MTFQTPSKLRWDLGQQTLGVLSCDFQCTDPDRLQAAQQALDLSFFAFGLPFIGQPSAKPVGDETEPHVATGAKRLSDLIPSVEILPPLALPVRPANGNG